MRVKVDSNKFEKLLITHWTDFMNVREIRNFCTEIAVLHHDMNPHCKVRQLSLSRFEPLKTSNYFIIWIETTISQPDKEIKATIECLLSLAGELIYENSTLDNV